jgi:Asp/Glu/hydantoin racemase
MTRTLALIHTVAGNIGPFKELCAEIMPDVETVNVVDESLLKNTVRLGRLTPETTRRVLAHVLTAADGGADAVLVTCSSIGPAVDLARAAASVPVIRVDEAMADQAVKSGQRIGVIATLATTLEPTAELVRARAAAAGVNVELTSHLCEGAFEALGRGETATHDEMVLAGLRELLDRVDIIVLAQASMARVADTLPPAERRVPILSSPRSGVERAHEAMRVGAPAICRRPGQAQTLSAGPGGLSNPLGPALGPSGCFTPRRTVRGRSPWRVADHRRPSPRP